MVIPNSVQKMLARLRENGFAAYAVGGCVRDTLMGRVPEDWDICTAARPEEIAQCFSDHRVIETGLKHGTVTVLSEGTAYEITTFRREGTYLNHRKPEQVEFVSRLQEDLLRRDFTINAMAADETGNVTDLYGGKADLEKRILRCVGDPDARFQEDALRILRGLRFASQLGFTIEAETAAAIRRNQALLQYISGERIFREMSKLLMGDHAVPVLSEFAEVIAVFLPELKATFGFWQYSPYHNMDVWEHTLEALSKSKPILMVRWTLLLHDIGKPAAFTRDQNGRGHFVGHPLMGAEMAEGIMRRLHMDNETRKTICTLVKYHDYMAPASKKTARKWISLFGKQTLELLLEVKRCDVLAHVDAPACRQRYDNLMELKKLIQTAVAEENCFCVKDLAVNGNDLLTVGVPAGPEIGRQLELLLEDVLEERCENDREALLTRLRESYSREKEAKHDC